MKKGTEGAMQIDRRHFLKGSAVAAALAGAGALVGCAPKTQDAAETAPEPTTEVAAGEGSSAAENLEELYECWMPPQGEPAFVADPITDIASTEEWDVVIVGMGAAGSAAAACAAANGLKTLVVEKQTTQAMNPGDLLAINAKVQTESGFKAPSYDLFMDAMMTTSCYRASGEKLDAFYHRSGEAFDWLYDNAIHPAGIAAEPEFPDFDDGFSQGWTRIVNACLTWEGGRMRMNEVHEAVAACATSNGAEIRFETPAVQLVSGAEGSVTGVVVKQKDGTYAQMNASKGVILAAGGYAANMEFMKTRMRPRDYSTIAAVQYPNNGVTGDAIAMGLAVGAAEASAPQSAALNGYGLAETHMMSILLNAPWMRVNERGLRFVNEEVTLNFLGSAIASQPRGRCWDLLDKNFLEAAAKFKELKAYSGELSLVIDMVTEEAVEELVQTGAAVKADTVEELAEAMGVDAAVLAETCKRITEDAKAGADTQFGNTSIYALDTPPFYAIHEGTTLLNTCDGLITDSAARVLTNTSEVISGLYAVGDCAGGIWNGGLYTHQCYGSDWGAAVTFAYLAVQAILGRA